jgi:hypothetical protein
MNRLSEVTGIDPVSIDMKLHDTSGKRFILAFLQELLFAQLVQSQ